MNLRKYLCSHSICHSQIVYGNVQEVTRAQGEELARKYKMKFIETSAKSGEGVDEAFTMIAGDVMDRLMKNGQFDDPNTNVKLTANKKSKKGCCN
mgnify:CR=1 FL=1